MTILWVWLICINCIAFLVYGLDKKKAKARHRRIPEKTLFLLALLGGGIGCLGGMYLLRHKTKHLSFVIGIPLITVAEAVVLYAAVMKFGL